MQIDYKVLQLLLVDFKMLHNHVVRESISLVKELPLVQVVVRVLLCYPIDFQTVPIHKNCMLVISLLRWNGQPSSLMLLGANLRISAITACNTYR